jgi:diphosphomevalonate decarboxylase
MFGSKNKITWQSPGNIALIKYWGKKGLQLPSNPSVSLTLSQSVTETGLEYVFAPSMGNLSLDFFFEGEQKPAFEKRIRRYFEGLIGELPFICHYHFTIRSKNTFPHSAGMASSASAFSALALCLSSMEQQLDEGEENQDEAFYRRASELARLGSGSAARSVFGGWVTWGQTSLIPGSSDSFAGPLPGNIHPLFRTLHDSILVVGRDEKEVSSSAGHAMMNGHPYAEARFKQANKNLEKIIEAVRAGDFSAFSETVENEALSLHALMMSSQPGFILLKSPSLEIIRKVRHFRAQTGAKVCFTMDAGPNVHLLYPAEESEKIEKFINEELVAYCVDGMVIRDRMGEGPVRLT